MGFLQRALGERLGVVCHWAVSRVIVAAERPAAEPRNCSNAGTKSTEDIPSK